MDKNKHTLNEGAVPYSQRLCIKDIPPQRIQNAREYLRSQGCLSQEEFDARLAKYL